MTLAEKTARPGPKRLLALDGGGIRGLISVEILAEIEMRLARELGAGPEFVLADYFDYIAGTSTGGIIAVLLSLGWSAARIRAFYVDHGREMFRHAIAPWRIYRSLYRATDLSATLANLIGPDTTLGSDRLRTLLLLVMRNADTDSPWPLSNNPAAKYNARGDANCNLELPLWQLVRASAAAPLFFPPEILRVGRTKFAFTDGGMTSYNNPAFLLFLMATLAPYNLALADRRRPDASRFDRHGHQPAPANRTGPEYFHRNHVGADGSAIRRPGAAGRAVPGVRQVPCRRSD